MACGENNSRNQCCDLFPFASLLGSIWPLLSIKHSWNKHGHKNCFEQGEDPIFYGINRVGEIKSICMSLYIYI